MCVVGWKVMGEDGRRGVLRESYQPGVYVPLKALFLVLSVHFYQ